jgi:hypothetical protein
VARRRGLDLGLPARNSERGLGDGSAGLPILEGVKSALVAAFAALLLAVPPVAIAAPPSLSPQDRQQIGVLIDRFIKDAVLRRDLPDAWSLLGPSLSGGTTKKAWDAGTGVTVENYPARGTDFRNAWSGEVVRPGDVVLSLMLHPTAGHPDIPQTAFKAEVVKTGGGWIVNTFYPAATFSAGGNVQGPADFGAQASGKTIGEGKARIRAIWFAIGISIVGAVVVLLPISFFVRAKRRDRRAYASYLGTNR